MEKTDQLKAKLADWEEALKSCNKDKLKELLQGGYHHKTLQESHPKNGPLYRVIKAGNVECTKLLLECGAEIANEGDLDKYWTNDYPPLTLVAVKGQTELMNVLLQHLVKTCNVEALSHIGHAIYNMALKGNIETMIALIESFNTVKQKCRLSDLKKKDLVILISMVSGNIFAKISYHRLGSALVVAAGKGHTECVQILLRQYDVRAVFEGINEDVVNSLDALGLCNKSEMLSSFRKIPEYLPDDEDHCNIGEIISCRDLIKAIYDAAEQRQMEVLKLLLEAGIPVNGLPKYFANWSPLLGAVNIYNIDFDKNIYYDKNNLHDDDFLLHYPLDHQSIDLMKAEIIDILLNHGAQIYIHQHNFDFKPLDKLQVFAKANKFGLSLVMKRLLQEIEFEDFKVISDVLLSDVVTQYQCHEGHVSIVEQLLNVGANPNCNIQQHHLPQESPPQSYLYYILNRLSTNKSLRFYGICQLGYKVLDIFKEFIKANVIIHDCMDITFKNAAKSHNIMQICALAGFDNVTIKYVREEGNHEHELLINFDRNKSPMELICLCRRKVREELYRNKNIGEINHLALPKGVVRFLNYDALYDAS